MLVEAEKLSGELTATLSILREVSIAYESKISEVRRLTGTGPSFAFIKVHLSRALKTAVMGTPLHLEHMAPGDRRTVAALRQRGRRVFGNGSTLRAARRRQRQRGINMREIVKLAKQINAGEVGNHRLKSAWYEVIAKLAADQRRAGETAKQGFARFVSEDEGGRALIKAYGSASGPDFQPAPKAAPVIKADGAYAKLERIHKSLHGKSRTC